jgi:4-amino-4-deoxy-L-arabinose transferase-like glycosyltransferase
MSEARMASGTIPDSSRILHQLALVGILFVAAFFRFYRLDSIPPGLTHDEADTGYFVASIYRGTPAPVDVPYGYAYKPFTRYSGALFMALFGPTDFALRLHAAFFGTLLVLVTYLWGREVFGRTVGLGAAGLMAVSFWAVSTSRFALNPPPAPVLFGGAVVFLWRALDDRRERRRWWVWALFALLLAGSLYAYETAIAAAASLPLLLVYLACVRRSRFRRHGAWFAGALIVAGLLAAPHLLDPASWARTGAQSGPLRAASQGDLRPIASQIIGALGTFSISGDSLVTYNLPGRPIFDPIASLFFYGGIALCLWRWKTPRYAFTLMWLTAGMLPSFVTGEWGSTLHSGGAKIPILVLPALCAVEVGHYLVRRFGSHWANLFAVGSIIWLAVIAGSTGYDYFVRWGQSPETRAAYFHNLTAITDYLNRTSYSGLVTLSSPFPDRPLDPFIAELRLHREDLSLRWFDARGALVFPETTSSLFVLPPNTPLADYFAQQLHLQLVDRVHLQPNDVDPTFDVYEWNPSATRSRLLASATRQAVVGDQALDLPVSAGNAVALLGYQLLTPRVAPGGGVTLVTFWRVLNPQALGPLPADAYGHSATIFVHALDEETTVVAQEDRLDAPAWNWHAGDVLAQVHRFQVDVDTPPGLYPLEVGIYTDHDLARLPIIANGVSQEDRVLLQPLEIGDQ